MLIMQLTVILKMDFIVTVIMVPIASLNREANVQLIKQEYNFILLHTVLQKISKIALWIREDFAETNIVLHGAIF